MQQGDKFNSIDSACEAIKRYVLDNGESFKLKKSNKKRYSIVCKETACDFAI
jgi:MuDR family transposase